MKTALILGVLRLRFARDDGIGRTGVCVGGRCGVVSGGGLGCECGGAGWVVLVGLGDGGGWGGGGVG